MHYYEDYGIPSKPEHYLVGLVVNYRPEFRALEVVLRFPGDKGVSLLLSTSYLDKIEPGMTHLTDVRPPSVVTKP